MITTEIRAYGDLNDFLPEARRQVSFDHRIRHPTSIRDLIEGLGIPHPEIALILLDGTPVGFDTLIDQPCRITAYPRFSRLPPDARLPLQPDPSGDPAFILDTHLGRLARYLRLLGFDSRYDNTADDEQLVRGAETEQRLLLTQDRRLLMRRSVRWGYYVRASAPRRQIEEVVRRLRLRNRCTPFTRCLACNGRIEPVAKSDIEEQLEPKTRRYYESFWQCHGCERIYWRGSHYERLSRMVIGLTSDPPRLHSRSNDERIGTGQCSTLSA